MKANFKTALKTVLVYEGGYANHPKDPGGATNKGITQRVYNSYLARKGKTAKSVKQITQAEVEEIYKQQYWDAVQGDRLPAGIDLAVFDFAVNSGASRAIRSVQKVLNMSDYKLLTSEVVKQDGAIGEVTLAGAKAAAEADEVKFIRLYCEERFRFVKSLRTFSTFGDGWTRRIMGKKLGAQDDDVGVIDIATAIALKDTPPVPKIAAPGKADAADVKIETTPEGSATGVAGAGAIGTGATKLGVGGWIGNQIISLGELAGFTKDQLEPYVGYSEYIGYAFMAFGILGVIGIVAIQVKKRQEGREG